MILILGGTSDSLIIAENLSKDFLVMISVATEMGSASAKRVKDRCKVIVGRKNAGELRSFLQENHIRCVVDGTHPYAVEVSRNGREAAEACRIPYLRFSRPSTADGTGQHTERPEGAETNWSVSDAAEPKEAGIKETAPILFLKDYTEAAAFLEKREGVIFSTLGSKNLSVFIEGISDKRRIVARILPDGDSIKILTDAGLTYDQIIAMKGPFSQEMNQLMLKEKGAAFLLTKDSGAAGGYAEKLEAAKTLGISVIVIKRTPEQEAEHVFSDFNSLYFEVKAVMEKC